MDNNTDVLDDVDAKELTSKTRDSLGGDKFAVPSKRKLPIHDASHVRNALARFNQTQGLTPAEKSAARARIRRAAKKFGVSVNAELDDTIQAVALPLTLVIEAKSLDLPEVLDHPNRHYFSGVLTKIGVVSDTAPHGSGGKRVLLTRECAEGALNSLLGMGIDLAHDLKGHAAQSKIGIISEATIDGEDLRISGFLYAADFPAETLKIVLQQADLGFSFEARSLRVESTDTDPLVVKSCFFTGAAILMKDAAAYRLTSIAAAAAKEHEMDEIQEAIAKAIEAALGPLNQTLGEIAAAQTAQSADIEELKKTPEVKAMEANRAIMAMVAPHVASCHAAADAMEKNSPPIGVGVNGHVGHLRRLALHMAAEAANGRLPAEFHDSGSAWAAADQPTKPSTEDDDVNVKDAPEFKELQASAAKTADELKQSQDAFVKQQDEIASLSTMIKDMKASIDGLRPSPQRKTMAPEIASILARAGLAAPEEEGGTIAIGKIDAALANIPGMDTGQRMRLKTALGRAGIIAP